MSKIPEKFTQPYNPTETEGRIYDMWEKSGYFNPDVCIENGICAADAEPFSIVLPPPNTTGILHMGHASMVTIEDIMVRFARMQGKRTLWVPGTDHAAIATDAKVAKLLDKKGIKKRDIGREKFLEHVHEFVHENQGEILNQARSLGASLDWSREAFTLDETRQEAVFEAFKRMYEAGLIYRGHRIVNWDPKGQTTISDDEIVRVEDTAKFYYFQYGPFVIGTARPETKFADKYIIVHPDDERYAHYNHMQEFEVEWINGPITATLIKDEIADPELGTGAMTITPWHSQVDFELAEKYDLPKQQIIDRYGKLLPVAGEFAGMKITAAREQIVAKLEAKGLLVKIEENHVLQKATAERTGGVIEPQVMEQWFIDVNKPVALPHSEIPGVTSGQEISLKDLMLHVVREKHIEILPERFEKIYFHWVENLRDWCISRQIWFGHRIPVWYKDGNIEVSKENPGEGWHQDEDTLDTWFSSGLWTFSTLGWPNQSEDFKTYHPTSVLETGYDIIFFWVARMILMTTFLTGQVPFKTVYLHGMVRDEKGRKLSKSLGNNIDPRTTSETYGTDAVRMAIVVGVGPGADNNLGENKIKAYKKFANKLWNISRFVLENTTDYDAAKHDKAALGTYGNLSEELDQLITDITPEMEAFKYYLVSEKLYHYVWHRFADEIIEELKPIVQDEHHPNRTEAQAALWEILTTTLKLLHPFMPFITEEIWQSLPHEPERDQLMITSWPKTS